MAGTAKSTILHHTVEGHRIFYSFTAGFRIISCLPLTGVNDGQILIARRYRRSLRTNDKFHIIIHCTGNSMSIVSHPFLYADHEGKLSSVLRAVDIPSSLSARIPLCRSLCRSPTSPFLSLSSCGRSEETRPSGQSWHCNSLGGGIISYFRGFIWLWIQQQRNRPTPAWQNNG